MDSKANWIPWLGSELEKLGFKVTSPDMPGAKDPMPDEWVAALEEIADTTDGETVMAGHSLGAQTILKYLEKPNRPIAAAVLIAPWPNFNRIKDSAYSRMAKRWMDRDPDWAPIKRNAAHVAAFFSTTDPYVLVDNAEIFKEHLNANIFMEDAHGHFTGREIPSVLKYIKSVMK